jgi:predicted nucleotidyltransferase
MPYAPILEQRRIEIASICRRYKVAELAVFGSAAGANFSSESDVDFLVAFAPGAQIGLLEFGELQAELEATLHRKVDLVSKSGLKPLVRETVLRQAEPVYAG